MNQPAPTQTVPYIPPGHPVRRFVLAIALVGAILGGVWWWGIGRPQLSSQVTEAGPTDAVIVLTNDGRTSLDVRDVSFEDPRLEAESVQLPGDSLSPGEAVEFSVHFTAVCTPAPPGGYYIPLRVTARTTLGFDRTITAGNVSTLGDLVCDASTDVSE